MHGSPAPPCTNCDSLAQPDDDLEGEPVCATDYVDHFNGGCSSSPPVFGQSLSFDRIVWGTSGNWYDRQAGYFFRDTDWYTFTTATRTRVSWCAVGQFLITTAILGPGLPEPCDSIAIYSDFALANPCDTACATATLEPGTYWLFVSPQTFWNTFCGLDYRAWITHTPGCTDTVRDVSIRRIGNNLVLRWTADSSFTGTYTIYQSDEDVPFPGSDWTISASGIQPALGHQRTVYAIENAVVTGERKYYIVVSDYPY